MPTLWMLRDQIPQIGSFEGVFNLCIGCMGAAVDYILIERIIKLKHILRNQRKLFAQAFEFDVLNIDSVD